MGESDKSPAELLRAEAVAAHATGKFERALELRQEAHSLMDPSDLAYAGNMTTIGATLERLGQHSEGMGWIRASRELLASQLENPPSEEHCRAAERELPIATMYLGSLTLKQGIEMELSEGPPDYSDSKIKGGRELLDESWVQVKKNRKKAGKPFHQHQINFIRRVSMARSVDGDPGAGLRLAAGAVALALVSESPSTTSETSKLSLQSKLKAKSKALGGGSAALIVASLGFLPGRQSRGLMLRAAGKTL